jgi:nickel-dependent lactate racemase
LRYAFRKVTLGNLINNPFYDEIISLAHAGKLDFIINSVIDHNDNLHQVVAGDPVSAHKKGADICKKIISKPLRKRRISP